MAGGNLSPRQKMINLMYLVFVAMLAMNMSKEVLSAFGLMNEKFEGANTSAAQTNKDMLTVLDQKATESKSQFGGAAATAHKVVDATKKFYEFVQSLKGEVTKDIELDNGKLPYEAMDKGDKIDELWFSGENYSPKGKAVIDAIETYKSELKAALGNEKKYQSILNDFLSKFDTKDVKKTDGSTDKYLNYHFKGFPAIASLAKLSAWQSDAKKVESDVIAAALGKAAVDAASMKNYQAIVVLEKNAYFQGEQVKGKVVLGRYDENTKPTSFKGPGKLENGQAVISMTAGGIGEQKIGGEFTFLEDGKNIPLKFEGTYVVVPRPNQAIISADKMNVVYRGIENPISVSIPGVSSNDVNASAPGMRAAGAKGKYILVPTTGNEVKITATGKLPDGKTVSSTVPFRIKALPSPQGRIRGEASPKGPKSSLEVSTVTAVMEDFDFPITVTVKQFNLKVPGQPTVVVQGNKMNGAALAAIKRAGRGDVVTISEIKAEFNGLSVRPKATTPCSFEIQ